jgi:hypothetical protein
MEGSSPNNRHSPLSYLHLYCRIIWFTLEMTAASIKVKSPQERYGLFPFLYGILTCITMFCFFLYPFALQSFFFGLWGILQFNAAISFGFKTLMHGFNAWMQLCAFRR